MHVLASLLAALAPAAADHVQFDVALHGGSSSGGAEVALWAVDRIPTALDWRAPGRLELPDVEIADQDAPAWRFAVRAPGHATSYGELRPGDTSVHVDLRPGRRLALSIRPPAERELPRDFAPLVTSRELAAAFWNGVGADGAAPAGAATLASVVLERLGPSEWSLHLQDDDAAPEHVLVVHAPGLLRGYAVALEEQAGANERLQVFLPAPATLRAAVLPPETGSAPYDHAGVRVGVVLRDEAGNQRVYGLAEREAEGDRASLELDDLAPGTYLVDGRTWRTDGGPGGLFRQREVVRLEPGAEQQQTFRYAEFDPTILAGDFSAELAVVDAQGRAVAGAPYSLEYYDSTFGMQPVREGALDERGRVTLSGLAGGERALRFRLSVDGLSAGEIELAGGEREREIELVLPPRAGDPAPDLAMRDLATGETVRLSDFRGQHVFLDFWATWCGPCQQPMAHNDDVMERRAADWRGAATILALSIDDSVQLVVDHVEARGWTHVPHFYADEEGRTGWKSVAVERYGVSSIPTCLIVDPKGTIVWRGHPATIDVEERLDALVAGVGE